MSADPAPFSLEAEGRTGVLLLHGLTGSPAEMRPLGAHLAAAGYPVVAPRLPGHGTRVEDLRAVSYRAWIDHAASELEALRDRCDRVVVGALSMGTLVAAHLAARGVDGLVVMAPALRINLPVPIRFSGALRYVWRYANKPPSVDSPEVEAACWSYAKIPIASLYELHRLQRSTERQLAQIKAPAMVIGGRLDRTVPAFAVEDYFAGLGSADKELHWLEGTGHVVPVDADRELVFSRVEAFVARLDDRA